MRPTVVIADTTGGLPAAFEAIFAPVRRRRSRHPCRQQGLCKAQRRPLLARHATPTQLSSTPSSAGCATTAIDAWRSWRTPRTASPPGSSSPSPATTASPAATALRRSTWTRDARSPYTLEGESTPIRISRRLFETFIDPARRPGSFYLSLPKLKTHSMATVTLGVKNQQAFPIDEDRMHFHNHETLHPRLARLYRMVQPDFCIIEGLTATFNGHVPPRALLDESSARLNVLIGGRDTVAVDAVGAKALGYSVDEVEHLRLVDGMGAGRGPAREHRRHRRPQPLRQTLSARHPATLSPRRAHRRRAGAGLRRGLQGKHRMRAGDTEQRLSQPRRLQHRLRQGLRRRRPRGLARRHPRRGAVRDKRARSGAATALRRPSRSSR